MMKQFVLYIAFAALCLVVPTAADSQVMGERDYLGSETVEEKSKRGRIRTGRGGSTYSGVQLEIPGGAKVVKRVTVQFADRSSESFNDNRLNLHQGRSDVLWFRSRNQTIERVSLLYFPDVGAYKGTEIRVYGVR